MTTTVHNFDFETGVCSAHNAHCSMAATEPESVPSLERITYTYADVPALVEELRPLHAAIGAVKTQAAKTRREEAYWARLYRIEPREVRRVVAAKAERHEGGAA